MRNFALNPKGVPERMKKVLEASRANSLMGQEQLQYFRAMISETEKEDIATANYQDGYLDSTFDTARRMLAGNEPIKKIVKYTGLAVEQIEALGAQGAQ